MTDQIMSPSTKTKTTAAMAKTRSYRLRTSSAWSVTAGGGKAASQPLATRATAARPSSTESFFMVEMIRALGGGRSAAIPSALVGFQRSAHGIGGLGASPRMIWVCQL